jgi:periplasmic copper chaperone A
MRHRFAIPALAALMAAPAFAQHAAQPAGGVTVEVPWARATPPAAKAGGVFMDLANGTGQPDRLVAARSDLAERVELHTHIKDGDIMRMREVEGGVPVPAGQTVRLQPGGLHVMLMGLKQPLAAGTSFPLTLTFEKAGQVRIDVPVQAIGAAGPMAHGTSGSMGSHMGGHPAAPGN